MYSQYIRTTATRIPLCWKHETQPRSLILSHSSAVLQKLSQNLTQSVIFRLLQDYYLTLFTSVTINQPAQTSY